MKLFQLITLAALCAPLAHAADATLPSPNSDARSAHLAARSPQAEDGVRELFSLLRSGQHAKLATRLDALIEGAARTSPTRDAVLYRFAVGLADFDQVDAAILERLRTVRPTVMVPHPERADIGVPLFDIAGAAAGVTRLQARRQAQSRAAAVVASDPGELVETYLAAAGADRAGIVDALGSTPDLALSEVLHAALRRLPVAPELTPLAGKSALLLRDAAALRQIVRFGSGAELARILDAAALTLPLDDSWALLSFAVAKAPRNNAALAIAQLYPDLAGHAGADELLFARLGDPALGAAAALALGRSGGADARSRLAALAQSDGPAAARARTALGLADDRGVE